MESTGGLGGAIEVVASLVSGALEAPDLGLMTDRGVLELMTAADRAVSLVEAARAVAIREVDRRVAAENEAHCSTAEFLHRGLGHTIQRCRMIVRDAKRRGEYARLTAAEANGAVTGEQGSVIAHGLALMPDDLGAEVLGRCEDTLVGLAGSLDPGELVQAVWRVLEHEAPERADEILAERLEREEKAARKNRGLALSDDGHGTLHIKGRIPIADGEELAAVLNAHAESAWRQQLDHDGEGAELRPRDKKVLLADALMTLVRGHQAHRQAPTHGGDRPRVNVHLNYADLVGGLGDMVMSGGAFISAAEARRLACDCDLIPMVLDSLGIPLDVGRTERLVNPHLRAAVVARDRGCVFPGCDRGPAECEVHHLRPWWAGELVKFSV
ncbi:DUF222 domain-containing protein [Ammonicoccus fulvus]|uniref:DUF222 domain-containing protein n=1 Tax=Ammonicoccus fulvus TaxID=3138240 RepID=A0ABZ3FMR0_9ACTN